MEVLEFPKDPAKAEDGTVDSCGEHVMLKVNSKHTCPLKKRGLTSMLHDGSTSSNLGFNRRLVITGSTCFGHRGRSGGLLPDVRKPWWTRSGLDPPVEASQARPHVCICPHVQRLH